MAIKQISEPPLPPRDIEPSIPLPIEAAILHCLEKNPDKRFRSVDELEAALEKSAERDGGTNTLSTQLPISVKGTFSPKWNRSPLWLGILILSLFASPVIRFFWGKSKPTVSKMHQNSTVYAVTFSPDASLLASVSEDKTIKIWDVVKRHEVRTWADPQAVTSVV